MTYIVWPDGGEYGNIAAAVRAADHLAADLLSTDEASVEKHGIRQYTARGFAKYVQRFEHDALVSVGEPCDGCLREAAEDMAFETMREDRVLARLGCE